MSQIFCSDLNEFDSLSKDLFRLLNVLISYYQEQKNQVFQENDIKAIITFYRYYSLTTVDQDKVVYYHPLSLNRLVSLYLQQKDIKIQTTRQQIGELKLQKHQQIMFTQQLQFFYERQGNCNHHLFYKFKNKFLNYNSNFEDQSQEYFDKEFQQFFDRDFFLEEMYIQYLNKKNNDFINFVEKNFDLILMDEFAKLKREIIKLLMLSIHCLEQQRIVTVCQLLNKLFTENRWFQYDNYNDFSQVYRDKLSNQKFNQLCLYKNHNIVLVSCKKGLQKNILETDIVPLNQYSLEQLRCYGSQFKQVVILDDNFQFVEQFYIVESYNLPKDFYEFKNKKFLEQKYKEFKDSKFQPGFISDLFYESYEEQQQEQHQISRFSKAGFQIYLKLDIQQDMQQKKLYKINKFLKREQNPMKNFQILTKITEQMIKGLKNTNYNGLILKNFHQMYQFAKLSDKHFNSIEDLKQEIYSNQSDEIYNLNQLLKTNKILNPFLIYIRLQLLYNFDDFNFILADNQFSPILTQTAFLDEFYNNINQCDNLQSILCEFYMKTKYFPLNLNLIMINDQQDNQSIQLNIFYKFLQEIFQISYYHICEKEVFLKSSNDSIINVEFEDNNASISLLPLDSNVQNDHMFLALYQENQIFILRKNQKKEKQKIQLNLQFLFQDMLRKNMLSNVNSVFYEGKCIEIHEFFLNNFEFISDDRIHVQKIQLIQNEKLQTIFNLQGKDQFSYQFQQFFWRSQSEENINENVIQNFFKVLQNLDIKSVKDLLGFFNSEYIKNCKQKQEFINLVLKTIQDQFKDIDQNIFKSKNDIQEALDFFKLNEVVVLSPEYGKFMKVGGLAVMIEDLSSELAYLNENIIVICPYFNLDKNDKTDYLKKFDPKYKFNLILNLHHVTYEIGVNQIDIDNITFYFLHNFYLFPKIYTYHNKAQQIKSISVFNYAALKLVQYLSLKPSIVLTNDWFAGLAAAYAKKGFFDDWFDQSKFLHIIHNLDDDYQGRIYVDKNENQDEFIFYTGLDYDDLIDPYWEIPIINPCRSALKYSDQWSTVSKSYRREILENSSLQYFLQQYKKPFAFPNGVRQNVLMEKLKGLGDHLQEKKKLMKKFLNIELKNDQEYKKYILFGFLGRICKQKGVLLQLNIVESLIKKYNGKICFILAGQIDKSDYSYECSGKMGYLKNKYPNNFWADPENFFYDGPSLNRGSDYFLMPSLFEPGGIVQHESLIAGTPVIAFKTGGLQDSIFEYNKTNKKGNGFIFIYYNEQDFQFAIDRSVELYLEYPAEYKQLRKNSENSYISVSDQAKAWRGEFYRLTEKSAPLQNIDFDQIKNLYQSNDKIYFDDLYNQYLKIYFKTASDDEIIYYMKKEEYTNRFYYNKKQLSGVCLKFYGDGQRLINNKMMSLQNEKGETFNIEF